MSVGYREMCIMAYGEKCDICGSEENIVAHHIKGRLAGDGLENLVPLCHDCHGLVHHGNPSDNHEIAKYQSALKHQQRIPKDMVYDPHRREWLGD